MNLPPDKNAEEYIALVKTFMPDFHRIACAASEEEFCEAASLAVRNCLQKLEGRRKLLANAGEVELSTDLADLLTQGGVPTTAESHINGHVDLVMEHFEKGRYRMLGECKLDDGPQYHCDGTKQLLGYCSGVEKRTLCLDFCKKEKIAERMKKKRQHFEQDSDCHSVKSLEDNHIPWSFLGKHQHSSGEDIEVLHIACNLYNDKK